MVRSILTISFLALAVVPAFAEPDLGAELRLQQQVLMTRDGDLLQDVARDTIGLSTASLRLKAQGSSGPWSYSAHYLLEAAYSGEFAPISALAPAPPAKNIFDLEDTIGKGHDGILAQRIDRAWIAYSSPTTVIRVGRQALTWGHGQVFRPLDLFNPFAPDAQDTSYKPGADMAYAQYLFDSGADIQALVVPRRRNGGGLNWKDSSLAVKGFWFMGSVETEIVAASDYGDGVFAVGAAGPLGEALWKFDLVSTWMEDGGAALSAVANLNDSWSWDGRPVTGFVEYYRNGFGVSDRRAASELPGDLVERISRGQGFNTSRDYLAAGGTLQWTPLLMLAPTLIVDLNDASVLAVAQADYSLSNSVSLVGGAQFPFGSRRTEFGGRALMPGLHEYDAAPARLYLRAEVYL